MKIVIAFSPIGDKLRKRINKFSNLISCCYIDWYNVWSDDALISIALKEI
jgi:dynein heavy chain